MERRGDRVRVRLVVGPAVTVLAERECGTDEPLHLSATATRGRTWREGPDSLSAAVGAGASFVRLAEIDGRYVSTEVAGGFTGRVVGVEALGSPARVHSFAYRPGGCDERTKAER